MIITLDNLKTLLNALNISIDKLIDEKLAQFKEEITPEKAIENSAGGIVYSINTDTANVEEDFYANNAGGTTYRFTVKTINDIIEGDAIYK